MFWFSGLRSSPPLRRPGALGPRVGGVREHRVGLPQSLHAAKRALKRLSYNPLPSYKAPRLPARLLKLR